MKKSTKNNKKKNQDSTRILSALPVPACAIGKGGRVCFWNQRIESLTGVSSESILGKKAWHGLLSERGDTPLDTTLTAEEEQNIIEFVLTHAETGLESHVSVSTALSYDDDKEVSGVTAVFLPVEKPPVEESTAPDDSAVEKEAFIYGELERLVMNIGKLASGDFELDLAPPEINESVEDLAGMFMVVNESLEMTVNAVSQQIEDINSLIKATKEGRLDERIDESAHQGKYGELIQGVNSMIEAVAEPTQNVAETIQSIADGVLPEETATHYSGEFEKLNNNTQVLSNNIRKVSEQIKFLSTEISEGRLDSRASTEGTDGIWKDLIGGINTSIEIALTMIETLSAPAFVINTEMEVQYMNLAATQILGSSKTETRGKKCYDLFEAGDCKTEDCGCAKAMKDMDWVEHETTLNLGNKTLDIAYSASPLFDLNTEIVGAFEVITDQTELKKSIRTSQKQNEFQNIQSEKLVSNLAKVAQGDFAIDTSIEQTDEETKNLEHHYQSINQALSETVEAVQRLVADSSDLTEAGIRGELSTRADTTTHSGEFRKVIEGFNSTLDAIIHPISEASNVLASFAACDLRPRVLGNYQGDLARIKESVNATGEALVEAMLRVTQAVGQVNEASSQIAARSEDLARGSSEQAASIQQTSASLEQMSSMTKQNADNTFEARKVTDVTQDAAEKGTLAMAEMMSAMQKIRSSSESTSEIIRDINEIAFQTNLLALNAAVEAARAGDAGRGFAVVAEEVRNLAQRAKEAAKKTEDLIRDSMNLSDNGQKVAQDVDNNLADIVESVSKVADIVDQISVASNEQASGIEQLNMTVSQMDRIVQSSASNAQQSSGVAQDLAGQSRELQHLVSQFLIEEE